MTVKLSQLLGIGLLLLVSWIGAAGISIAVVEWRDDDTMAGEKYVDCIFAEAPGGSFESVQFGRTTNPPTTLAGAILFVQQNLEGVSGVYNQNWARWGTGLQTRLESARGS